MNRALEPRRAPSRPLRLVVAEDDQEMRRLLTVALARDGHTVAAVASGTELLRELRVRFESGAPPDVILSDVRMPGMSGLDVLRALRASGVFTPVILITAFGRRELHEEAQELGAAAVLDKPFELASVRAKIEEIWRRSGPG